MYQIAIICLGFLMMMSFVVIITLALLTAFVIMSKIIK